MIAKILNEFREKNCVPPMFYMLAKENKYCLQHCHYMAKIDRLAHTPSELLCGKSEAVARCSFLDTAENTMRHLVFKVIGDSLPHTRVILDHSCLAYGVHAHFCTMYITIRGW